MYLHDIGDPKASFTKEQMQAGKHTEYMKELLDDFMARQAFAASGSNNTEIGADVIDNKRDQLQNPPPGDAMCPAEMTTIVASNRETQFRRSPTPPPPLSVGYRPCTPSLEACSAPSGERGFLMPATDSHVASSCNSYKASNNCLFDAHHSILDADPSPAASTFADIDFDPIRESQAGLAELLASEPHPSHSPNPIPPSSAPQTVLHHPQQHHQNMFSPPPGFENSPAAPPEDFSNLLVSPASYQALFDATYGQFAQLAATASAFVRASFQMQQQQNRWSSMSNMDVDILTQLLREAMHLDTKGSSSQGSQSVVGDAGNASATTSGPSSASAVGFKGFASSPAATAASNVGSPI